ncbi:trypsin-like peptidase domain-containing protein [Streptomyces sp. NBC_01618]|uniref:nSTAND1 domain-containing NTPase n=1 Tax=Streptomyces sp. NBC_01618 TaxID=2975900 RepID=UPI00386BB80C|nr:trypsin-like peptidase domain-containing protein [Streptomyces sp. NBC_01618]
MSVRDGLSTGHGRNSFVGAAPDLTASGEAHGSVPDSVVQVLAADGEVAGAGFLAGEGVVVTCAHVVRAAGQGPDGRVELAFPHLPSAPRVWGEVPAEQWRKPEAEDIAFVELNSVPAGVRALSLGSGAGCQGHRVSSFGFPTQAPPGGHFGYGTAGDLLPDSTGTGELLQLSGANSLTTGFSGGPVVDGATGLVIGMVTSITTPDAHLRGLGIAYATPVDVLRQVRPELAEHEVCPYLGLEPFTAGDVGWFHGRDAAVEEVLEALGGHRRMLMLLGSSGAGKTSMVNAGVLPALASGALPGSDRWLSVVVRPGPDFFAELESAGLPGASTYGLTAAVEARLETEPDFDRLLLVVDQFEELLTQPGPASGSGASERRQSAASQLVELSDSPVAVTILLIMRNDFYAPLDAFAPHLMRAAFPGLLNVPATVGRRELEAIITKPAEAVGLRIENGLTERIINDVLEVESTGRQAPVTLLPPLELALRELWRRREDGRLTHAAYERTGQVTGSMTTWCDMALNQLPDDHRPIARRLLTALVRPADESGGIPATRHLVPLTRLRSLVVDAHRGGPDAESVFDAVLASLTRYRIVITGATTPRGATAGEPAAELIHDALVRDWVNLRKWVARDQQFHLWLHRVAEHQIRYSRSGLSGDLLDGSLLAEGLQWVGQRPLPADVSAIVTASRRHHQRAIRRTRRINIALIALVVLALIATGIAFQQQRSAATAERQALSRQLSAQSASLLTENADLALLLAVQAYRTSPTAEATASLEGASQFPLTRSFDVPEDARSVAFDPHDGNILAISRDTRVQLRDATTGKTFHTFTYGDTLSSIAFDPENSGILALAGTKGVQIRNTATGKLLNTVARSRTISAVAVDPKGNTLATGSVDGDVELWDMGTGRLIRSFDDPGASSSGSIESVAFSSNGHTLAAGNDLAWLWDVATGKVLRESPGEESEDSASSVAFSPDGKKLATGPGGAVGAKVKLWDATTGQNKATLASTDFVSVAFNPDGKAVATSGGNGVQLWSSETGQLQATLSRTPFTSVAFGPDGRTLAAIDEDREMVRLWDASIHQARGILPCTGNGPVAFSPDGRTLAASAPAFPYSIATLWDYHAEKSQNNPSCDDEGAPVGRLLGPLTLSDSPLGGFPVKFSPEGHLVATGPTYTMEGKIDRQAHLRGAVNGGSEMLPAGTMALAFHPKDIRTLAISDSADVRLWDLNTHKDWPLPGSSSETNLEFDPDGHTLATWGKDKGVQLWDLKTRKAWQLPRTSAQTDLEFDPDGHTLATWGAGKGVQLWDVKTRKVRTLPGTSSSTGAAFHPKDSRILATWGAGKGVQLWDVKTRKVRTLPGTSSSTGVAFHPKDSRILAVESDEGVQLWDIAIDHLWATLHDSGTTNGLYFSPDGRTLATSDSNSLPVRLWDVHLPHPPESIQQICKAVVRDLTRQEWSLYLPDQSPRAVCDS